MKIYRESTAIRGTKYQSYLISYFANGKRQRRRFADFTDASREAKKVVTVVTGGGWEIRFGNEEESQFPFSPL